MQLHTNNNDNNNCIRFGNIFYFIKNIFIINIGSSAARFTPHCKPSCSDGVFLKRSFLKTEYLFFAGENQKFYERGIMTLLDDGRKRTIPN